MNAQIPLPSFEDIRKILQFWIDQQDKWFYFETGMIQSGLSGDTLIPPQAYLKPDFSTTRTNEIFNYTQSRIVGRIFEVINYPPSLLLQDATVISVNLTFEYQNINVISREKRNKYGLVFSQITYYEPIENIESFINGDSRIND